MKFDRKLVAVAIVAILIGFSWGGGRWQRYPFIPVPIPTPSPSPDQDRPFLRFVFKAAKNLLWLAAFADPPPPEKPEQRLVHAPLVGEDGYQVVDHARGL